MMNMISECRVQTWKKAVLAFVLIPFSLAIFFFAIDRDSGAFLTIARGVLDGYIPYRDFFDHKPPGIYYTLSLPLLFSNGSIWAAKAFLLLVSGIVLVLVAKASKTFETDPGVMWWSVILTALGWVIYQGYTLVTEPFVALTVTGVLLFLLKGQSHLRLVGFLAGVAVLYKQPAFLFLFPVLTYVIFTFSAKSSWKILFGFALALLAGSLPFLASGSIRDAWEQIVIVNLLSLPTMELREVVKGDFKLFLEAATLWSAAILPFVTTRHSYNRRRIIFLESMLIAACFPALLHPTAHYILPAVPIAAILAAIGLRELERALPNHLAPALTVLVLLPLWVGFLFPTLAAFSRGILFQQIEAGRVLARLSRSNEPILVVAAEPQYYFLAQRYPLDKELYLLAINYTPQKEKAAIENLQLGRLSVVAIANTPPTDRYASQIRAYVKSKCVLVTTFNDLKLDIFKCAGSREGPE